MSNKKQGADNNRCSKSLQQEGRVFDSFRPIFCAKALLVDRGPEASSALMPACNCALHLRKMF